MGKWCSYSKPVPGKYDPVGGFCRIIKRSYFSYFLCQKGKFGLILRLKCCTFSVTGWISVKYKINDEISEKAKTERKVQKRWYKMVNLVSDGRGISPFGIS